MGLSNRFPQEVINFWTGWTFDLVELGHRTSNALHHIISPSSNRYQEGDFNESIFNFCPVDNFKNHIGQAMHYREKEDKLLCRVMTVLVDHDWKLTEKDKEFLSRYKLIDTYERIKNEKTNQYIPERSKVKV